MKNLKEQNSTKAQETVNDFMDSINTDIKNEQTEEKKRNKFFISIIIATTVCISIFFLVVNVVIPALTVNDAMEQMDNGNYEEAIEILKEEKSNEKHIELINQCSIKILENSKIGDTILLGYYSDYIEWTVVDTQDSGRLLVANYNVLNKAYNEDTDEDGFGDSDDYNLWSASTLRKWLNSDFFEKSFDENIKNIICTTNVMNDTASNYKKADENTQDKVFILSWDEQNKYKNIIKQGEGQIWTRTPSIYVGTVAVVYEIGSLSELHPEVNKSYGIRPAMWIDTKNHENTYSIEAPKYEEIDDDNDNTGISESDTEYDPYALYEYYIEHGICTPNSVDCRDGWHPCNQNKKTGYCNSCCKDNY